MTAKRPGRWRAVVVQGALYILGVAHWAAFLDFGRIPFGLYDWRQVHFYQSTLKMAVTAGEIPWRVAPAFHFNDLFLSSPLSMLAPQIILLRWMSLPVFEVLNVLLLYTVGFVGGVRFKAAFGLSWTAYLAFFLLFNFNGYLASHLAVGHVGGQGIGYFFLPWFFLGILEWVRSGPSRRLSLELALVIFAMGLVGSFHFCTWSVIFLVLLGLRRSGWLGPTIRVLGVSAGLAAYRLLPGLAGFGKLEFGSPAGYPAIGDMFAALAFLRPPGYPTVNAMGWWEYDMYVGWAGLAVLALYGALPLATRAGRLKPFARLDLPVAGMALLSYWEVYWFLLGGAPVLSVERVVSRMLIMPVVLLAMLAAVRLDELRSRINRIPYGSWLTVSVLALMTAQLACHSMTWRVSVLAARIPGSYAVPAAPVIVPGPALVYAASVLAGWAITLAALGAVVYALWKTGKRGRMS